MKSYLLVLEKWVPMYTAATIQVDDGVDDAIEAALDHASAVGRVRTEPKAGYWSMRCPAEAVDYLVPIEREPEVILLRRVSADSFNSDNCDENRTDRFADPVHGSA